MGIVGTGSDSVQSVKPARALWLDDHDGTVVKRLARFRSADLSQQARGELADRLERAKRVASAGWAAIMLESTRRVDVLTTSDIPAAIYRSLSDMRYSASMTSLPAYMKQRAGSHGFVVEVRPLCTTGELQGHLLLGYSIAQGKELSRGEGASLVADEISSFLEIFSLNARLGHIGSHLSLVHRLGQFVTSIREPAALFAQITRLVYTSLAYEHVQLFLTDFAKNRVELVHAEGAFSDALIAQGHSEAVGRGIVGRVAESGRMWISQDIDQDAYFVSNALLPNTASELALPLRLGKRVVGVLDLQSERRGVFRSDDVLLLQTIADQIAPVIEQHRLLAAERRERELADTLADVSRIISSKLEHHHVLEAVLRELGRVVPYRGSRVTLLGEDGRMRVVAAKGYPDNGLVKRHSFLPTQAALSRPVLERHQTLILNDVRLENEWVWQPGTEQIVSWCSAPLVHGQECIGWLCVDWPEPGFFTHEHGRVVRAFADQAVVAIENSRLFERARELSDILEFKVADRTLRLKAARDEIAKKADELQALWRRVVEVQERERQRIAYDLHDSVAQSILAATYELQAIRRRVASDADLHRRATECQAMLDASLTEMKHIIYALRPNVLDELGLLAALENYVASLPRMGGSLDIQLTVSGRSTLNDKDAELAVFRIVQEACQNSIRHASAQRLSLCIRCSSEELEVCISDDGKGFLLTDVTTGLGLVGIRERAKVAGGDVFIESKPDCGTTVRFCVPCLNVTQ